MKQRQYEFISLMSMLTVFWSLCQGCPNQPGPACAEELPNAIAITSLLKQSLRDFYRSLVERGYESREFQGPVCILGSASGMDLDSIDTRLCQYTKCLQEFAFIIRRYRIHENRLTYCQKFLSQLKTTIKKMKWPSSPSCTSQCTFSWPNNETTGKWEEITKGPRIAEELLAYLDQLKLSC